MYEYAARVVRVVDGDTVDVDIDLGFSINMKKQRIRMYGINAPESRTKDLEEKERGLKAKEYLKTLLEVESVVLQTHLDDRGKFGRILGTFIVELDGESVNVNETMVATGHAVEYMK